MPRCEAYYTGSLTVNLRRGDSDHGEVVGGGDWALEMEFCVVDEGLYVGVE